MQSLASTCSKGKYCCCLLQSFDHFSDACCVCSVGDVFELRPMGTEVREESPGAAKFLFVGRGIDKAALEADLVKCLRTKTPSK